jgi:CO dehydrogenase nickel-insertion accessory protein CooC1
LVVVEPGWASLQTAGRVAALAADLGIKRIGAVANRVASEADLAFVRTHLSSPPLLGVLPADPDLEREARECSYAKDRPFHREMARVASMLNTLVHEFGNVRARGKSNWK